MNEYDLRQYQRMADCLNRFRKGDLSLGNLIGDLEALLDVLGTSDENWKTAVKDQWRIMEINYAVALDRNSKLSPEDETQVQDAVEHIEQLLIPKLQEAAT
ncbi:MAG: hypothetical protein JOZ57_15240 [Abitibacteriaceae bacterium]|nr:hypothetical protein [Abditibacteriaceae bacterium]